MLYNQLILALDLPGLGSSSVSAPNRDAEVERYLDRAMKQNPGKNVFNYHANHGKFSYEVSALAKQKGFNVRDGHATEYFNTLIFEGSASRTTETAGTRAGSLEETATSMTRLPPAGEVLVSASASGRSRWEYIIMK